MSRCVEAPEDTSSALRAAGQAAGWSERACREAELDLSVGGGRDAECTSPSGLMLRTCPLHYTETVTCRVGHRYLPVGWSASTFRCLTAIKAPRDCGRVAGGSHRAARQCINLRDPASQSVDVEAACPVRSSRTASSARPRAAFLTVGVSRSDQSERSTASTAPRRSQERHQLAAARGDCIFR